MTDTAHTAKEVFLAALEQEEHSQRVAYLDMACAGNPQLRKRVEALLCVHDKPDALFDQPAAIHISSNANSVDFLEPSSRPDSLGRLGHYEVLEVIGSGGMGIVLKAFDEKLHRVVALKLMAPILAMSALARQRFVREARAAAAVTHEHLTAVHAVEDGGPYPYLVMQYVPGCTLQDKLDRCGALPVKDVLRIGTQITDGLVAAHRKGLIHRDIKPANILLEDGTRVKITDFGLAGVVDTEGLMQSLMIAGTPAFMSPEQAEGRAIDCRSDLFSLGSVLYTLCAGKPPFAGETSVAVLKRIREESPPLLREVNSECPPWLEMIIAKLLAKRPEERYSSAVEVAEVLGRYLAQLQAGDEPAHDSELRQAKRSPSLRRVLLRSGAVVLCIGLGWAIRTAVWDRESPPGIVPSPEAPPSTPSQPVVLNATRTLTRHVGRVRVAAFSPNGKILATAGEDRRVLLWDTTSWEAREIHTPHQAEVIWLAFAPNGTRLATVSYEKEDCHVRLWDVSEAKAAGSLGGESAGVWSVCWSPDGTRIAAGGWDKTLRVWEVGTGAEVFSVPNVADQYVRSLAYSPKGDLIVTGGSGPTRLLDATNGTAVGGTFPVELCPMFLPQGDRIAGWNYKPGRIFVCDVPSGQIRASWRAQTGTIDGLAVSPDGRFLASVGKDDAHVWATDTQQEVATLRGHQGLIYTAAFSPDGATLATGGLDDFTVRIWELPSICRVRK